MTATALDLKEPRPGLVGHRRRMSVPATDNDDAARETMPRAGRASDGVQYRPSASSA